MARSAPADAVRLRWRSAAQFGAGSRAARPKCPRTIRVHHGVAAGAVGFAAPEQLVPPTVYEAALAPKVGCLPANARPAHLTRRNPVSGAAHPFTLP